MADSGLGNLQKQAADLWKNLGTSQKIAIGVVGLLTVGVVVFLLTWARTTEYATLFSNLQADDAAAIVAKLKEAKTPYELTDNGATIMVPSDLVYDTRLQMASAGLPQGGGVGFEIFDQTNFGMTDFLQQVDYQRALEGELSRTINQLSPVEESRVHIVIPQQTLYTDNQQESTASVVLKLKPGQRLNDNQVRGIAQLVASSVQGLKTGNITIVDANGNILSDGLAGANSPGLDTSQLNSQDAFETDLEQKIQGLLDRVLGFGKSTVRVQAQFNYDQQETSSETYSPNNNQPQPTSVHQTIERTDGGTSVGIGGIPGTQSNIPTYSSLITGTNTISGTSGVTSTLQGPYAKTDVTTNYQLSKTVDKITKATGNLQKLSVAVVLDAPQQADGTPIDVNSITTLVSAAAGIDPARGDVLAVTSIPFSNTVATDDIKAMDAAQQMENNLQMAKIGAMAVGPVLLFMLLLLVTRRGRSRKKEDVVRLPGGKQQAIPAPAMLTAIEQRQTETPEVINLIREDSKQRVVKEQVTNLVKTQPSAVADLIKNWMSEDVNNGNYPFGNNIPSN